jgi:serine/threonine protein phosphatase PrpC
LPRVSALAFESEVRSDRGRVRPNNADSAFASPRLVAVADGVGGAAAGEVAIELALAAGGRDNVSVVVADVVPRCDPASGWAVSQP